VGRDSRVRETARPTYKRVARDRRGSKVFCREWSNFGAEWRFCGGERRQRPKLEIRNSKLRQLRNAQNAEWADSGQLTGDSETR